jgi:phage terminase large subunit-like protein
VPSTASKWIRADAVSPEFEGGLVVLPCSAPWLDAWMAEHTSFPNAVHDEAVDTTSLALSVLKSVPERVRQIPIVQTGIPDRDDRATKMLARLKRRDS